MPPKTKLEVPDWFTDLTGGDVFYLSKPITATSREQDKPAIRATNTAKAPALGLAIEAKGTVRIDGPLIVNGTVTALEVSSQAIDRLDKRRSDADDLLRAEIGKIKEFLKATSGKYGAYTSGYFD